MANPITILIVDDSEIIRKGLHSFLDTQSDFKVIGESGSGSEAIEFVIRQIPDVVLLDMSMPDMDGVETTIRIKRVSPHTQVVILTSLSGDKYSFPALRAGAISYLLKNIKMDELADALRCAARGEATLHPHVAASILHYLRGEQSGDNLFLTSLSDREMDVLKLIAGALTNSQIAQKLRISENTVKGHVSNIRTKLQIANRVHLAMFAWENGIVVPSSDIP
jgi:NarL family two-component system response regulator LiaR